MRAPAKLKTQIKRKWFLLFTCAVVFGFLCYNPFLFYFQNDDFYQLSKPSLLQDISVRPLADLSIWIDKMIWNKTAFGFHLTNLLIHLSVSFCTGLLMFNILKRFSEFKENWVELSFIAGSIFFIYPFHSEAVFWILGRAAGIGTLFFLLSLLSLIKEKIWRSNIYMLMGLLAYESVVTIVPVALLYLYITKPKFSKIKIFSHVITLVIYLVYRFAFIHGLLKDYDASNFRSLNFLFLFTNYLKFIPRIFIPPFLKSVYFLLAALFFWILIIMAWYINSFRKTPAWCKWIACCLLISPLPYLSIGINTHTIEAERFIYLPSVFGCLLIAYILYRNPFYFSVAVILCESFFLFSAVKNNYVASAITRSAIELISEIKTDTLIITHLPKTQNGALIFRSNIKEAIHLYNPGIKVVLIRDTASNQTTWRIPGIRKKIINDNINKSEIMFTDSCIIIAVGSQQNKH